MFRHLWKVGLALVVLTVGLSATAQAQYGYRGHYGGIGAAFIAAGHSELRLTELRVTTTTTSTAYDLLRRRGYNNYYVAARCGTTRRTTITIPVDLSRTAITTTICRAITICIAAVTITGKQHW